MPQHEPFVKVSLKATSPCYVNTTWEGWLGRDFDNFKHSWTFKAAGQDFTTVGAIKRYMLEKDVQSLGIQKHCSRCPFVVPYQSMSRRGKAWKKRAHILVAGDKYKHEGKFWKVQQIVQNKRAVAEKIVETWRKQNADAMALREKLAAKGITPAGILSHHTYVIVPRFRSPNYGQQLQLQWLVLQSIDGP